MLRLGFDVNAREFYMSKYVPLSKTMHRYAGLTAVGHAHALTQSVVPVVVEELPHVIATMATAFIAASRYQGFDLVALQSLEPQTNLYVHTNGRWIGGYKPAWYRQHPFRLLPDESGEKRVVCVDETSDAFVGEAGEQAVRLFDDEGEPTRCTHDTIAFLEKLQKATDVTQSLINQLNNAGVIVPWQMTAKTKEREEGLEVGGLYHIDEDLLRALEPDKLARLASSGALSLAYAQLMSEHRLQGLARLARLRERTNQKSKEPDVDLESLFRDDDDDLSFAF